MATFQARIEDLVGSVSDTQLMTDSMTDAVKDVINILPYECLWLVSQESAVQSANGYTQTNTCKVLQVQREGGVDGYYINCKEISPAYVGGLSNVNSMFYASEDNPVFLKKSGKIYVYPEPVATTGEFKVTEVGYPVVLYTDSLIRSAGATITSVTCEADDAVFTTTGAHGLTVGDTVQLSGFLEVSDDDPYDLINGMTTQVLATPNSTTFTLEGIVANSISEDLDGGTVVKLANGFPEELTHTVVLGASIKCLYSFLHGTITGIPSSPLAPVLGTAPATPTLDQTLANAVSSFAYTGPSAPSSPSGPSFSYTKPGISLSGIPSISDLDLSLIAPPAEPSAPAFTYTKPSVSIDSIPSIDDLDLSGISAPVPPPDPSIAYEDATGGDGSASSIGMTSTTDIANITIPESPLYVKPILMLDVIPVIDDIDLSTITAPVAPGIPTITYTVATNSDASADDISTITIPPVSDMGSATDIAFVTAPTYTQPALTLNNVPDIDDLDLSTITVPTAPPAPALTYTPASNSDATNNDAGATELVAPTVNSATTVGDATFGSLPGAPSYTPPVLDNDVQGTITTAIGDEDVELAQSIIQQFQGSLGEYQADIQNELNIFNQSLSVYKAGMQSQSTDIEAKSKKMITQAQIDSSEMLKQADLDLQTAMQNAKAVTEVSLRNKAQDQALAMFNKQQDQALAIGNAVKDFEQDVAEYSASIQRYQAEIASYNNQVNSAVQEYKVNEIDNQLMAWNKRNLDSLDAYGKDIQNELNKYNKENAIYQTDFQAELAEMKSAITVGQANLQKDISMAQKQADVELQEKMKDGDLGTQVDITNKAQDQALDLQNKAKIFEAQVADWNADIQLYQQDVQAYQANIATSVQEYTINEITRELSAWRDYNASKIQQYGQDIQNELNEYNKGNGVFQAGMQAEIQKMQTALQKSLKDAELEIARLTKEADLATNVDVSNKAQAQVLSLQNEAKTLEAGVSDYTLTLQRFANDTALYQADIGASVQEYTINELQKQLTAWNQYNTTKIQVYSSDIQNELNIYNLDVTEYQSKIAKYTGDLERYKARIALEVQEYTINELQKEIATWESSENRLVQQYAQDIQNEVSDFNKDVSEYQGKISKYQADIQSFQAQLGIAVQDYQILVQKHTSELDEATKFNGELIVKYQADIQNIQSEDSMKLQKYQGEISSYQVESQNVLQDHKSKLESLQDLKSQYNEALKAFMSQYTPVGGGEA